MLALLALLAGCGRPGGYGYTEYGAPPFGQNYAPTHYYPPPGPPDDPWGPYIREAAGRYDVPERWIRAVMKQESGGEEQATSPVGAMGLMQVMPATYDTLRDRYGLGADPYDPHNNILAGAAYIREMYDRFGAPGFLAAYNAGPDRVEHYLAGASDLPDETVNYLAAVTPNLGGAVTLSGPFATYGATRSYRVAAASPDAASLAAGCDLSAAYNPQHPCTSLMRAALAPAPMPQAPRPQTGPGGCDLGAAYDPSRPCTTAGETIATTLAAEPISAAPVIRQPAVLQAGPGGCDLSAAYDAARPCTSAGAVVAAAAPAPPTEAGGSLAAAGVVSGSASSPAQGGPLRLAAADKCGEPANDDPPSPCGATAAASVTSHRSGFAASLHERGAQRPPPVATALAAAAAGSEVLALPQRNWAIQVGAFASPALAKAVAEAARAQAPGQLGAAAVTLPPIASGGAVLYRARLGNLSASAAANACTNLNRKQLPCVVVQPAQG